MSTLNLLELTGVHTHIGAYHILHGVDLAVPEGEVTMLLGRNGAGKTTTLRTIMGLWPPAKAACASRASDIKAGHARHRHAGHRLRAREHGHLHRPHGEGEHGAGRAQARNASELDTQRLDWIFGLFPALKKFWLYPAGKLSGGQKQMLAVARAIVEPRALILIDEPSKGLAPSIIRTSSTPSRTEAQKTTILLVEQNFMMAKALGDTVAVMDNGRVVHRGSHGRAGRRRGAAAAAAGLVAGGAPMSAIEPPPLASLPASPAAASGRAEGPVRLAPAGPAGG
jgi:branched-chain amino acid transport system ATP-binding protein